MTEQRLNCRLAYLLRPTGIKVSQALIVHLAPCGEFCHQSISKVQKAAIVMFRVEAMVTLVCASFGHSQSDRSLLLRLLILLV